MLDRVRPIPPVLVALLPKGVAGRVEPKQQEIPVLASLLDPAADQGPTVRGSARREHLIPVAWHAEELLPLDVACPVELYDPHVAAIVGAKGDRASGDDVAAACCFDERPHGIFVQSAVGVLPENVAVGSELEHPDVGNAGAKRVAFARYQVVSVAVLEDARHVLSVSTRACVVAGPTVRVLPLDVAVGGELEHPVVGAAGTDRGRTAGYDVAPVAGNIDRPGLLLARPAVRLLPLDRSARREFDHPHVALGYAEGLGPAGGDEAAIRALAHIHQGVLTRPAIGLLPLDVTVSVELYHPSISVRESAEGISIAYHDSAPVRSDAQAFHLFGPASA